MHENVIKRVEKELMCDKRRMSDHERLFFRMGLHFQQVACDIVFRNSGEKALEAFAKEMLDENERFDNKELFEFHKMFCENCAQSEGRREHNA